jgi:hypothetical protein
MSTARKSILTLAAMIMAAGLVAPSFALDISGVDGESADAGHKGDPGGGGPSSPPPVTVCFYIFGGQICVTGGGLGFPP